MVGRLGFPAPPMLRGGDVLVVDLQDMDARYYPFVWTAALAMRACAEADVPVVVLDRPDPLDDWFEFLSALPRGRAGMGGRLRQDRRRGARRGGRGRRAGAHS